jgi:hypothetical protein
MRVSLLAAALALSAFALAPADLLVGAFSRGSVGGTPQGWATMAMPGAQTHYGLVVRDGRTVLKATARASAAGLVRRIQPEPGRFRFVEWDWTVEGVIPGADLSRRSGDDAPARLYVTFDYDRSRLSAGDRLRYRALRALGYDPPVRAICYVWASEPGARPRFNPYSSWVWVIPVDAGPQHAGTWRRHRRDVLDDYRRAFGEEPPAINGVAVMTDADDTKGEAVAYYGDIRLRAE